jgi:hypothetical protein
MIQEIKPRFKQQQASQDPKPMHGGCSHIWFEALELFHYVQNTHHHTSRLHLLLAILQAQHNAFNQTQPEWYFAAQAHNTPTRLAALAQGFTPA